MRSLRFSEYLHIYRIELRKLLSYRLDFWLNSFGIVFVSLLVSYFLWHSIYTSSGKQFIGGFSLNSMILYYFCAPLTMRTTMGESIGFMSREIYDGGHNRYILYPTHFFAFKYAMNLAHSTIYFFQLALVMLCYFYIFDFPVDSKLSIQSILLFIPSVFLSSVLYFYLASCLELISFWAEHVWTLLVWNRMIIQIFGGAFIPLALFPNWAHKILYLLPYSHIVSEPVKTLLGTLSWQNYLIGISLKLFWIVFFAALSRYIWNRGQYHYTGVGI